MTLRERIAKAIGDTVVVSGHFLELADAALSALADKEPPSDKELYNQVCLVEIAHTQTQDDVGVAWRRAIYDFGHARGVASQEQELARLREELNELREQLAVAEPSCLARRC